MPELQDGDVLLVADGAQAVLRPAAGGRVCSLTLCHANGRTVPVLYPYTAAGVDPLHWGKGGIYPLVPYSGRIARARLQTPQGEVTLAPHPDVLPHTLHGNAHGQAWQVLAFDDASATLALDSAASAAWPWRYRCELTCTLERQALQMRLSLRHEEARPMPCGLGLHPYFLHEPGARLRYQAGSRWDTTPEHLAWRERPLQAHESFETWRPLPQGPLTDVVSRWDGRLALDLPSGDGIELQADPLLSHLVIHRPEPPLYLCVEPASHVVDGFNLAASGVAGTGAVLLTAGQTLQADLRIALQ